MIRAALRLTSSFYFVDAGSVFQELFGFDFCLCKLIAGRFRALRFSADISWSSVGLTAKLPCPCRFIEGLHRNKAHEHCLIRFPGDQHSVEVALCYRKR